MKYLILVVAVCSLAACQSRNDSSVRTHDYALYDEEEAAPRHRGRESFSAVEAAEMEDDDVCVGQFCNCEVE